MRMRKALAVYHELYNQLEAEYGIFIRDADELSRFFIEELDSIQSIGLDEPEAVCKARWRVVRGLLREPKYVLGTRKKQLYRHNQMTKFQRYFEEEYDDYHSALLYSVAHFCRTN